VDVDVARRAGWAPRDLAHAYLGGGAKLLQLRAKTLGGAEFLDLAAAIAEDARLSGARLIVNDRPDIAVLAGAAGVHLGQDDLTPTDVRKLTGEVAIIGFSTHTRVQMDAAVEQPISYLAIGPVFGTNTKDTGYDHVGLGAVAEAVSVATPRALPVVAIGGITLETAASVLAAGAASLAIITDLLVGHPEARVRQYLAVIR
jgi:thiamine-phosphate pyrophosphorylase